MEVADVVIVGGGIAGLSAAWHLSGLGLGKVVLLEKESLLCSHSSGRNAAIFRHLSGPAGDVALAVRSKVLLDELFGARWLKRTGTLFLSSERARLERLSSLGAPEGVPGRWLSPQAARDCAPWLGALEGLEALFSEQDGVMDIHTVTSGLAGKLRERGVQLRLGTEVSALSVDAGRVGGVQLSSGQRLSAGKVVLAAGAWAASLAAAAGAHLPLTPLRRHLVLLDSTAVSPDGPVVWRVDGDESYFRAESGGVLACPCDEEPWQPELPPQSGAALELLARKLSDLSPRLSEASVRSAWACLRTFAPDRSAVVGEDPRVLGLYWLAGLGGHGMTGALAAGEVLAEAVCQRPSALALLLRPSRLV